MMIIIHVVTNGQTDGRSNRTTDELNRYQHADWLAMCDAA